MTPARLPQSREAGKEHLSKRASPQASTRVPGPREPCSADKDIGITGNAASGLARAWTGVCGFSVSCWAGVCTSAVDAARRPWWPASLHERPVHGVERVRLPLLVPSAIPRSAKTAEPVIAPVPCFFQVLGTLHGNSTESNTFCSARGALEQVPWWVSGLRPTLLCSPPLSLHPQAARQRVKWTAITVIGCVGARLRGAIGWREAEWPHF